MALPPITIDDFSTGSIKIVTNGLSKDEKLQSYIDEFYPYYLDEIVGQPARLNAELNTFQKWDDLLTGVVYTDLEGEQKQNTGITEQVRRLIYTEYMRDNFESTVVGMTMNQSENSENKTGAQVSAVVSARWNRANRELGGPVLAFLENYETRKEMITGFTDNADNTYEIDIASTLYLEVNDTVTIAGVNYTVTAIIPDASFTIDAGQTGLSFSSNVEWSPFELVNFCTIGFMTV